MSINLWFLLGDLMNILILKHSTWFQHLESVIRARIPGIISLINKTIDELETELDYLGRPVAVDAGVSSSKYFFNYTLSCEVSENS